MPSGANSDTLFEVGSIGQNRPVNPKLVTQTRSWGSRAMPKPEPSSPPPE